MDARPHTPDMPLAGLPFPHAHQQALQREMRRGVQQDRRRRIEARNRPVAATAGGPGGTGTARVALFMDGMAEWRDRTGAPAGRATRRNAAKALRRAFLRGDLGPTARAAA